MRTRSVIVLLSLSALLLALPVHAVAQQTTAVDDLRMAIGGRVWINTGSSTRHIGGNAARSDLDWRGLDAVVPEVNLDVEWGRFVLLAAIGGGWIGDGVLVDDDFNAAGTLVSSTRSTVEDSSLFYISADVGYRVIRWDTPRAIMPGYVDVLLGYQYWREDYEGFGAAGTPATGVSSGTRAITNTYEWHSLRLGARTEVPVSGGLSLKLRGYIVPWTSLVIEDVHHLRGDLLQDPSFRDEADGGFGVQVDGAVSYAITNRLSVDVGFQYWMLDAAEGDDFAFTPVGTFRQPLREATTERYGPFVGVRWRF